MTTGTESPAAGGLADGANTAPAAGTGEARVDAIVNGAAPPIEITQDMIDWGKAKGYKPDNFVKALKENPDLYNMATSYRNTEKMVHGERLVMPKDEADTEGWNLLFGKLGRPEKADDYKLTMPETVTPEFGNWAKSTMHELGLNQKQAEGFTQKFVARMGETEQQKVANMKTEAAKQDASLQKEWGADYKGNLEIASRARAAMAKSVGLQGTELDKMEEVFGYAKSLKMMEMMGRSLKLDSDTFEGAGTGERATGTTQSVEGAKAMKDKLFADPGFVKKYNANDADSRAKIAALNMIIAPTYNA